MGTTTQPRSNVRLVLAFLLFCLFALFASCCGGYTLLSRIFSADEVTEPVQVSGSLVLAYSPEKEPVLTELVERFNAQGLEALDGQSLRVELVALDPEAMVNAVLEGNTPFQAMTPDSSVWLGQIDEEWRLQNNDQEAIIVGETVRYAVSPVVIAMWESTAREMGWPDQGTSWQDLLDRAQSDPNFRWSHPSTSSASGLLATLAEFYAGAQKTRGLTIDDVTNQATLDYVAALEKSVRYYGEGNEPAIIEQALAEGRDFLDAFVVQEQMVINFNTRRQQQERLVAIYPIEGALWQDHPLALLETSNVTTLQRQVFAQFRDFLLSSDAQQLLLQYGYRPADLSIPLDTAGSPLTAENGVDPSEPKTALQVPNASVIRVVRDVWWYTKRHTNVYLVVDTSGSMEGEKLAQAQEALHIFVDQIKGDLERVGLLEFATSVYTAVPMEELGENRTALGLAIDGLEAQGDTALLDGVEEAYNRLQARADSERINAIVVMTDGMENNSVTTLSRLVRRLQRGEQVPVVVFCIAYGDDADMRTLQSIAESTGGQVRKGDLETIRELYRLLSTYF